MYYYVFICLSKVKVGREDMLSLVNTLVKKLLKISTLRASPCITLPSGFIKALIVE